MPLCQTCSGKNPHQYSRAWIHLDQAFSICASINEVQARAQGVPVEEVRRQVEGQILLGRCEIPEELAMVAAFLASLANGYVTGQAILVDGGMVRAL